MSSTATPQWEESVAKARSAIGKSFEGRIEAALASFEQIPGGSGRKKTGAQNLAQFSLDAGIEYKALEEYRAVTKWLSDNPAGAGFSDAIDVSRGIGSYSTAREAMNTKKWKSGKTFARFILENDPPAPFTKWTLDALRVHLNMKPTNTGQKALALAAGEDVSEFEMQEAAALDHTQEAIGEIEQVKGTLAQTILAADCSDLIEAAYPKTGAEARAMEKALSHLNLLGDIADATALLESYLDGVEEWLSRYGDKVFEGETGAEIMRSSLTEKKGRTDLAFGKLGIGTDIDRDFAGLLGGKE